MFQPMVSLPLSPFIVITKTKDIPWISSAGCIFWRIRGRWRRDVCVSQVNTAKSSVAEWQRWSRPWTHAVNSHARSTMHHTLEIQEILLEILGYCRSPRTTSSTCDLATLARTCRAFKEPALDALWEELYNLSPLARCLPEASHQLSTGKVGWH